MRKPQATRAIDWRKFAPLLILAAGVLAYQNSFLNPFVFDDRYVIEQNPFILQQHLWPPWQPTRLIADVSFLLTYIIAGATTANTPFNVAYYHAGNLLIHILAGLLLFGIVRRTLCLPSLRQRFGDDATGLAFAAAVLWVVHPIQTESVTYLCQRYESLMGVFYLLALYGLIRGGESGGSKSWHLGAVAACAAGMVTKEIMMTAPLVLLLFDVFFLGGSLRTALKERWKVHAAFAGTWAVLAGGLFCLAVQRDWLAGPAPEIGITPAEYALSQIVAAVLYLKLSLVPYPLCLDYCLPPPATLGQVALPAVVLLGLGLAIFWGLWKRSKMAFLGVWFFLILAPTSSFLPLADVVFEHRVYLSLAAVCVAAVLGVFEASRRLERRWEPGSAGIVRILRVVLLVAVTATLVVLSRDRNRDYASEEIMWRDVVAKRPDNVRASISLCGILIGQGRLREAEQTARAGLARIETFPKVRPDRVSNDLHLSARHDLRWIAQVQARLESNLGLAVFHQGREAEAIEHYRNVTNLWPQFIPARNNLAFAYLRQGRTNEAVEIWTKVLQDAPDNRTAHSMMGIVAEDQGRFKEAIAHYSTALAAKPGSTFLRGRLAWMLATHWDSALRNGAQALELAEALARSTAHQGVRVLDILAAACAEAGQFPEAVRWAEQALRLAREPAEARRGPGAKPPGGGEAALLPETGSPGKSEKDRARYLEELEQRLLLYRSGKAYHEAPPQPSASDNARAPSR